MKSYDKGVNEMNPLINIMRNVEIEKRFSAMLEVERDRETASLSQAIRNQDEQAIKSSKERLMEIHRQIESLNIHR